MITSITMPAERIVSLDCIEDLVDNGDDLANVVVTMGKAVCTPVWAALVSADEELLCKLLADNGPAACVMQVNMQDDGSKCSPLQCAAKLRLLDSVEQLLAARADVNARNGDLFNLGAGGFRLLPECGGRSALHLLCMQKESDATIRVCKQLLASRADVCAGDSLGLSPCNLATAHSNERLSALLTAAGAPERGGSELSSAELTRLCKEREDRWREADLADRRDRRRQSLAQIERDYPKRHPALFARDFLASCAQKALGGDIVGGHNSRVEMLCPGVYRIADFFPPEVCGQLLKESEGINQWAEENKFHVTRPNSMNRYGMILNDFGFMGAMHALMDQAVAPLTDDLGLLPRPCVAEAEEAVGGAKRFLSQHSFLVKYKAGEDEDLKTHRDDSDITLNVCLGRSFQGAGLYFHSDCNCSARSSTEFDEFTYPHPADCRFCTLRYQHTPGTAIFHVGRHVHGVDRLVEGERINLIMWCRTRGYPPEMC